MTSTYIVRHDNTFDYPSTWAFTDYGEAALLRDRLNAHMQPTAVDGEYHVEEEVHYATHYEVLAKLQEEGWFDDYDVDDPRGSPDLARKLAE